MTLGDSIGGPGSNDHGDVRGFVLAANIFHA